MTELNSGGDTYRGPNHSAQFLAGMARAAAAVCIVTTEGQAGRAGITVNSMTSVSVEPAALLVSLRRGSAVGRIVEQNGAFCVNVLCASQCNLSDVFSGRLGRDRDRFSCADWTTLETGCPALVGAACIFDCKIAEAHVFSTHLLVIGRVLAVEADPATSTLIYHNRQYHTLAAKV